MDNPATPTPNPPHPPKKILLVEDDDYLANVYQTRLAAEVFDVHRVADGQLALAEAEKYQPDLILLDIMMPNMNGLDVLTKLKQNPATAKIKVVMVSALGQETDQQKARELGANDYLVKSQVVIADVVERIKQQLDV